jgi:hypothetical protein
MSAGADEPELTERSPRESDFLARKLTIRVEHPVEMFQRADQ